MLFKIVGKLNSFASFTSFTDVAASLRDTVALDEGFSFGDAVSLAWKWRKVKSADVVRIDLSTRDYVTPAGAYVLLPVTTFNERLALFYPPAAW
jgi:hypothetical protein